jgi:opacity protein-like surface antigen
MIAFRRGILGVAAFVVVAASAGIACTSDIDDEPGNGTGGSGTGGSGTGGSGTGGSSGGGSFAECQPTAEVCYGNRPMTSPGNECLATIDNDGQDRVQMRQTWNRVIRPAGNTTETVYGILKTRTQVNLAECHMTGNGGYIQLTDWDRSNKTDITQQTLRSGYSSYSNLPVRGATPGATLVSEGLCMVEWDHTFGGPATLPPVPDTALTRWQDTAIPEAHRALAQPWHVEPVTMTRVAEDFESATLRGTIPPLEGRFFVDETTAFLHTYTPLAYVTILDNRTSGIAIPIREVEVITQFNDTSFNCIGRFRADAMDPTANCDPQTNQANPQWGCVDDNDCPPLAGLGTATGPGAAPSYSRGYFLIVDLERVWSVTLGSTLCVSYPGQQKSEDDGWANDSPTGWGLNCRGAPNWDPSLPDDAGLPMGDWCSKTNEAATTTCHDAYLSESYATGQAFKVKPDTCPLM